MPRSMPKSLKSWLVPRLRRLSMAWPGKTIARDRAKIYVQQGHYKNGNPIIRRYYVCANEYCGLLVDENGGSMDHIKPVIDLDGFENWDAYILSLFCDPNHYQHLCNICHSEKTTKENIVRDILKKRALTKSKK